MYPAFIVPGVAPEDTWQLFNVSNYVYYRQKVADLIRRVCPFCTIDPQVNYVLTENHSWRLWKNYMAPRSGQECQLIVPSIRHVERFSELTVQEILDFREMVRWANRELGIGDHGVWVLRTGDPARNAKSVPHLHFNFQYPTGKDRVEVTIAKSHEDLVKKHKVLLVFEKMRLAEEGGEKFPISCLNEEERELVKDKLAPPATQE